MNTSNFKKIMGLDSEMASATFHELLNASLVLHLVHVRARLAAVSISPGKPNKKRYKTRGG
jgi:hypothetical protein